MVENWEMRELGRRIDSLERGFERERERAQEERDRARKERDRIQAEARSRRDRRQELVMKVMWTLYVAAMTTYIVLAVTGKLHHH